MAVREKETVPEPRRKWRRILRWDVIEVLFGDDGEEGEEDEEAEVCSQRVGYSRCISGE